MNKPPYYFGLQNYLIRKEEGKTLEDSDEDQCKFMAELIRNQIVNFADLRNEWSVFCDMNPTDEVAVFVALKLRGFGPIRNFNGPDRRSK